METCTEIQSLRDSLIWDFFCTVYYDRIVFWANKYRHVGFNYVNDSCE